MSLTILFLVTVASRTHYSEDVFSTSATSNNDSIMAASNYVSSQAESIVSSVVSNHHQQQQQQHHAVAMIMSFLLPTIGIELGMIAIARFVTMPAIASTASGLCARSSKLSGFMRLGRNFLRRQQQRPGGGSLINIKTVSQGFRTIRRKLLVTARTVVGSSSSRQRSHNPSSSSSRRRQSTNNMVSVDYTYKDAPFSNTTSEILGL